MQLSHAQDEGKGSVPHWGLLAMLGQRIQLPPVCGGSIPSKMELLTWSGGTSCWLATISTLWIVASGGHWGGSCGTWRPHTEHHYQDHQESVDQASQPALSAGASWGLILFTIETVQPHCSLLILCHLNCLTFYVWTCPMLGAVESLVYRFGARQIACFSSSALISIFMFIVIQWRCELSVLITYHELCACQGGSQAGAEEPARLFLAE